MPTATDPHENQSEMPKMARMRTNTLSWAPYLLLLLVALLAASPLWGPGMVNTRGGGDSPFLLQRTMDMAENLRHGIFPPRWMAHAAYDLGYPFFNYYASLPYMLSGALTAIGANPIVAIQTTQTFGFVLAALTMALWAGRVYRSRTAVWLAVVAYTFVPFHLVNVYVRGDSLSEFYAFVWYPLILWALDRMAEHPTAWRIGVAGLAYGALILTHNVSALIFSPFAALYIVLAIYFPSSPRLPSNVYRLIALPFVLGILLTTWFWLPAIGEIDYGQLGTEFTEGYFHYSKHFRGLNLVQPTLLFDYSVAMRAEDAGPFAMGLVQALLALGGVLKILLAFPALNPPQERESKPLPPVYRLPSTVYRLPSTVYLIFILLGLLLSTFLVTPLSRFLWDTLPLLPIIQFPWRFLSVQALFTAIITGALAEWRSYPRACSEHVEAECAPNSKSLPKSSWPAEEKAATGKGPEAPARSQPHFVAVLAFLCLGGLTIGAAMLALKPERLLITDEDVTWETLGLYESFTGNIGTTIRHEYLPRDVVPRLYISEAVVGGESYPITDGDALLISKLLARTPIRQVWWVTLDSDASVAFPINWWPGWAATVDTMAASTYPVTGSGRLAVDLKAGEHVVTLRLRNTPLRTAAEIISIVTALGCVVWLVIRSGNGRDALRWYMPRQSRARGLEQLRAGSDAPRRGLERIPYRLLFTVYLPLAFLLSFILCTALNRPVNFGQGYAFDFLQMPYPHHGVLDFGAMKLQRTTPLFMYAAPGETLHIPCPEFVENSEVFGPAVPFTLTARLVSPAMPRHDVPYVLAETSPLYGDGKTPTGSQGSLQLPVLQDIARGLYLVELRVFGPDGEYHARTPQGRGMGALYIGAVRVSAGRPVEPDMAVLAQFTDLRLHSVDVEQPVPTQLRLTMAWSAPVRTPRNWTLSLRLIDASGRQIVQRDIQPGYGYLPTTLWAPDELVFDYPVLPLPEGLAPGSYTLQVVSYLRATMEGGGQADIPITLTQVSRRDLRDACCQQVRKGGTIRCRAQGVALVGLELPPEVQEGNRLDFTAEWSALDQPTADLSARWAVQDTAGNIMSTADGALAPGSHTTDWPRHAWVRTFVHMDMPPMLPDGPYHLLLTLLDADVEVATCVLSETLPIVACPRRFDIPELSHPQAAYFGDTVQLLGYEMGTEAKTLALTLWWQALDEIDKDYKRFVHLYNPATEQLVAQDDAMPRAWSYPTSWWAAGEVVSETIALDLSPVGKGEYRVAVGWYNPESLERLPVTGAHDERATVDRWTLDQPLVWK